MKRILCLLIALIFTAVVLFVVDEKDESKFLSALKKTESFARDEVSEKLKNDIVENAEIRDDNTDFSKTRESKSTNITQMRGVWLTYSEIDGLVKGKSESEYTKDINKLFETLANSKINTVFYQVRAFCDALYESDIFPVSKYAPSLQKDELQYDPFLIFCKTAKEFSVDVHAWINPFRVSYSNKTALLPSDSPALALFKKDKTSLIICDKGIYLNPSNESTRSLVLKGVKELVEHYDINGVHFDDYFYPECENIGDEKQYTAYKKSGGMLSVAEWRRENVSALMGSVYSLVKSSNAELLFGVSPAANIEKCRDIYFADVEKWCTCDGFIDYVIPQIYFGFENANMPFETTVEKWQKLVDTEKVTLVCGLSVYKSGKKDENAGKGNNEWVENSDIIAREYEYLQNNGSWSGFSLFSYSYCFGENITEYSEKEIKHLVSMLY